MAQERIYVATTPGIDTSWLKGTLEAAGLAARIEICNADSLDRHLDGDVTGRACLFVESPTAALARALANTPEVRCQEVLDHWSAASRKLLQRVLSQPARCLCADVDEIRRACGAWHEALARFLGVSRAQPTVAADPPDPKPNPLDDFIARAVVNEHGEAAELFDQLVACCVVLNAPARAAITAVAAAEAFREMRAATPQLATDPAVPPGEPLTGEVEALRDDVRETLDRLFTAQADLEAALHEREALRSECGTLRSEVEAERTNVRTTMEALADERTRLESVTSARESLRRELTAAHDRSLAQERLIEAANQSRDEARKTAEAAQQESEVLLEKLHEAHEQLGHYYLDARALRSLPAMLAHGDGPILGATGVHPSGEHGEGQHRHLDLVLRDVHFGGRRRPDARVRLVEHLGRPGLVLFSEPPAGPWLSAWETTGQEGSTAYMLIVPADAAGQALLSRLGRTDWQVVVDLAGLVLRGAQEGGLERWAEVARRLCRELAATPVRLRYDQLEVEQAGSGVCARFGNATFGAVEWPAISVQWTPEGASGRLEILAGGSGAFMPLARWPVGADAGTGRWTIPVGSSVGAREKRATWASLLEVDRMFVLALLDALPAVNGRGPAGATHLASVSRALLREAHSLLKGIARRRLFRRLLGRVASR